MFHNAEAFVTTGEARMTILNRQMIYRAYTPKKFDGPWRWKSGQYEYDGDGDGDNLTDLDLDDVLSNPTHYGRYRISVRYGSAPVRDAVRRIIQLEREANGERIASINLAESTYKLRVERARKALFGDGFEAGFQAALESK